MCFGTPTPKAPPPPAPAPAPQEPTARLVEDPAGVSARKKRTTTNPLLLSTPTLNVPGSAGGLMFGGAGA